MVGEGRPSTTFLVDKTPAPSVVDADHRARLAGYSYWLRQDRVFGPLGLAWLAVASQGAAVVFCFYDRSGRSSNGVQATVLGFVLAVLAWGLITQQRPMIVAARPIAGIMALLGALELLLPGACTRFIGAWAPGFGGTRIRTLCAAGMFFGLVGGTFMRGLFWERYMRFINGGDWPDGDNNARD
jgi:hypothetical protein